MIGLYMILIERSWQDRLDPLTRKSHDPRSLLPIPLAERQRVVLAIGKGHDSLKGQGSALIVALTPIY